MRPSTAADLHSDAAPFVPLRSSIAPLDADAKKGSHMPRRTKPPTRRTTNALARRVRRLERQVDALVLANTYLIRNAAAHGRETPAHTAHADQLAQAWIAKWGHTKSDA